jgi:hypothetical protein
MWIAAAAGFGLGFNSVNRLDERLFGREIKPTVSMLVPLTVESSSKPYVHTFEVDTSEDLFENPFPNLDMG